MSAARGDIFMSVKLKTILIVLIGCISLIIVSFGIYHVTIMKYIDDIECNNINKSFKTAQNVIGREEADIAETSLDWADWNDTYNFISGKNRQSYIDSNFSGDTLKQLKLNMMIFTDNSGSIVYSTSDGIEDEIKELLLNKILAKTNNNITTFKNVGEVHSGLINVLGKTFIIAVSPVTTSDGKMAGNGSLILVKYLDDKFNDYMDSIIKDKVYLKKALDTDKINNTYKSGDTITAYKILKDINGDMSIIISININRDEYMLSRFYFKIFASIFLAISCLIVFVMIHVYNKQILMRLNYINNFINDVAQTKDTDSRLIRNEKFKKDEITNIGNSINNLLNRIGTSYKNMETANKRFNLIMEATNDGYMDYNLITKECYLNTVWRKFFGYEGSSGKVDILKEKAHNISSDSLKCFNDKLMKFINGKEDYFEDEYQMKKTCGESVWVFHRGKVVERDSSGKPVRVINTILDVTDKKVFEYELSRAGYIDMLTGLKNKLYMQKMFSELSGCRYSIIVGDVNGLKVINDTFGYNEGDKLICKLGNILKSACAKDDIISRWSGDEFVILVFDKDHDYVSNLINNIKTRYEKIYDIDFKLSVACESADGSEKNSPEEVMNLAEERMYRSKLTERSSPRNATLTSLEKMLYEKSAETEEHTMRIKVLSMELGKRLNLPPDKMNELELLSMLHDIGKIGIPENILTKTTSLTDDEWKVMKSHAEIGYRIAEATPELSFVANEILCHHERFDGNGYPQGLKGDDIPILSRIISIVDSFDVMTHKRVYKNAQSMEYAVEELKRCSGSQFDPAIVDEFIKMLKEKKVI